MLVYEGIKNDFLDDVLTDKITNKIYDIPEYILK